MANQLLVGTRKGVFLLGRRGRGWRNLASPSSAAR